MSRVSYDDSWIHELRQGDEFWFRDTKQKWHEAIFVSKQNKRRGLVMFTQKNEKNDLIFKCKEEQMREVALGPFLKTQRMYIPKEDKKCPHIIYHGSSHVPIFALYLTTDRVHPQSKFQAIKPPGVGLSDKDECKFWLTHDDIVEVRVINSDALEDDRHEDCEKYKRAIRGHLIHAIRCVEIDMKEEDGDLNRTSSWRTLYNMFMLGFELCDLVKFLVLPELLMKEIRLVRRQVDDVFLQDANNLDEEKAKELYPNAIIRRSESPAMQRSESPIERNQAASHQDEAQRRMLSLPKQLKRALYSLETHHAWHLESWDHARAVSAALARKIKESVVDDGDSDDDWMGPAKYVPR